MSRVLVDGVHADLVGSQIGNKDEITGWIKDHLMRVRRILLGFDTGLGHFVAEDL